MSSCVSKRTSPNLGFRAGSYSELALRTERYLGPAHQHSVAHSFCLVSTLSGLAASQQIVRKASSMRSSLMHGRDGWDKWSEPSPTIVGAIVDVDLFRGGFEEAEQCCVSSRAVGSPHTAIKGTWTEELDETSWLSPFSLSQEPAP